ncbi:MAG: type I glutamate--ammonia ligase [Candidatus Polarisedimenticolia bacterium]
MARSEAESRAILRDEKIRFLRLVFTDIHGVVKNVEVPDPQFDKALAGEIMFDGSSIEGFVRIQESDMLLKPDLDSLRIFPSEGGDKDRIALLICDVANPDGGPFLGDPRGALRRAVAQAKKLGYRAMMGPEAEFFLFQRNADGSPTTNTHDQGAYFDLSPVDRGEDARRDIVNILEKMGFEVEAAHHEVAPGQHEIDFKYADALVTADNLIVFKQVVRMVALAHDLHATFMPKPLYGVNGSGMHTHQSLFTAEGKNAFDDPAGEWGLSTVARRYIGGVLAHAKALCAVTNPIVNSFKRLVPGYEAPTNIAWSERNRSPLARVPARRGVGTRVEVRMPDPSCNPYLAFAAMLCAGLDGMDKKIDCGPPVNKDIFQMSEREKRRLRIENLPANLKEAVEALEKDNVVLDALGPHIAEHFIAGKLQDWHDYISVVHPWELERYLSVH